MSEMRAGQRVKASWRNSFRRFTAEVEIVRVNAKSVRVRILSSLPDYAPGQEVTIPHEAVFP